MITVAEATDLLVASMHKEKVEEAIEKFRDKIVEIKIPKRGVLAFVKLKWR